MMKFSQAKKLRMIVSNSKCAGLSEISWQEKTWLKKTQGKSAKVVHKCAKSIHTKSTVPFANIFEQKRSTAAQKQIIICYLLLCP